MKLASAFAVWVAAAAAQTAGIGGQVRDSSGGGVQGVEVSALHLATGVRRGAITNGEGWYSMAVLRAGPYRITARRDGFRTVTRTGLDVNIGLAARLDFVLEVGAREDSITVMGEESGSRNEDASVGQVLRRDFIEHLPVNGRGLLTLLESAPGVLVTPSRMGFEAGQFSVAGQRAGSNYFSVDGVSANVGIEAGRAFRPGQSAVGAMPNLTLFGTLHNVVGLDAVEEFRVHTSTLPAEYGRVAGGQVVITTRTGTNQWHGTAAWRVRNEALDANDWFRNRAGVERARFRLQQPSATLGGPVRRESTFVFAAVETLWLRMPEARTAIVPSADFRSRAPAAARDLLDAFPLPNGAPAGPDSAEFFARDPGASRLINTSLRGDHGWRGVQTFARVWTSPSRRDTRLISARALRERLDSTGITGGATARVAASVENDLRINWTGVRLTERIRPGLSLRSLESILDPIGPPRETSHSLFVGGLPGILFDRGEADRRQRQWNVVESLGGLRGAHEWRVGADLRRTAFQIAARETSVSLAVANLDEFAANRAVFAGVTSQEPVSASSWNLSAYAQDRWRVRTGTSLTFGLRWEVNPAPQGVGGTQLVPLLERAGEVRLGQPGDPLWRTGWRSFAPRLGIAQVLTAGGTVVARGGVAWSYDAGYGGSIDNLTATPPYFLSKNYFQVPLRTGQAAYPLPSPSASDVPRLTGGHTNGFRSPRVWHANMALDVATARGMVTATWVSSGSSTLVRRELWIAPGPGLDSASILTNRGELSYHGLQIQWRGRAAGWLEVITHYTWSHAIDNSSHDLAVRARESAAADRGSSDYDVRHSAVGQLRLAPSAWRGWAIDGIARARTAFPVDLYAPVSLANGAPIDTVRPDFLGGATWLRVEGSPGGRRLNSAAFAVPPGRQGSLGRNAVRAFAFAQLDLALRREFSLGPARLEFRLEAFNLTNRPNFGPPFAEAGSPLFGVSMEMANRATGTGAPGSGVLPGFQTGAPRALQIGATLRF